MSSSISKKNKSRRTGMVRRALLLCLCVSLTVPASIASARGSGTEAAETSSAPESAAASAATVSSTTAPSTTAPSTTAPSTTAPSTTAPSTTAPSTTAPSTTAPSTTAPSTTAPSTTAPSTTAPSTTAPSTTEPEASSEETGGSDVDSAESVPYRPYAYDNIKQDVTLARVVNAATLNVRATAGKTGIIVAYLDRSVPVETTGVTKTVSGTEWIEIRTGLKTKSGKKLLGYISGEYAKVFTIKADSQDKYGDYLRGMGFPESYIPGLKALHEKHPQWVFVSGETGLEWSDAVWNEANPQNVYRGISLIHIDSISSWKSTKPGAYDWTTSTWNNNFDGPGWVEASDELVAYFMDPRNFLDDDAVFMFQDQTFTNHTVEGVSKILQNTFMAEADTVDADGKHFNYARVLYNIGKSYGISPYYLAASIRQEVGGNGSNKSISGKSALFPGYFNYYNIYAFTADGFDANDRGLWFASGQGAGYTSYNRPWNTRVKALWGGAKYMADNYILRSQNTLYYKRFNVTGADSLYRHQFMTNVMGAYSEGMHLSRAYDEEAKNQTLVFEIPIYKNMPEEACPKPTKDGSPNNKLSSLSVKNHTLSPKFNMNTQEYDLIVSEEDTAVITAKAYDSTAVISGTGTKKLEKGANQFKIKVKAENGDVRTYTINIYLENEAPKPVSPEEPFDTKYTVSEKGVLSGIEPGTLPKAFTAKLGPADGVTVKLFTASGAAKSKDAPMGTGDMAALYFDGSEIQRITVLLYGDANGDGKITLADLVKLRNHVLGTNALSKPYLSAADVNRDGGVKLSDMVKIRNYILDGTAILQ